MWRGSLLAQEPDQPQAQLAVPRTGHLFTAIHSSIGPSIHSLVHSFIHLLSHSLHRQVQAHPRRYGPSWGLPIMETLAPTLSSQHLPGDTREGTQQSGACLSPTDASTGGRARSLSHLPAGPPTRVLGTRDLGSTHRTSCSLSRPQLWLCQVPFEPRWVHGTRKRAPPREEDRLVPRILWAAASPPPRPPNPRVFVVTAQPWVLDMCLGRSRASQAL